MNALIRHRDTVLGTDMSSAGHPPAVLAAADRVTTTVQVEPDLPIGVANGRPRHSSEILSPFQPDW